MAYTAKNYRSRKDVEAALVAGKVIEVYQPGPFGPEVKDGAVALEGPHYPEPHRWYATGEVKGGVLVAVRNGKGKWVRAAAKVEQQTIADKLVKDAADEANISGDDIDLDALAFDLGNLY